MFPAQRHYLAYALAPLQKAFLQFLLYNLEMTNSLDSIPVSDSNLGSPELSAEERRQRWFEVCLVLLISFGGSILRSLYLLKVGPNGEPQGSNLRWLVGLFQESTALLLLGYVLSRRGMKFSDLGLRWRPRDVAAGGLVTVVSYAAYAFGHTLIQTIHYLVFGSWATGATARDFFLHPPVTAIPYFLLNPFFEELIVRVYLMSEVMELTGSSALAVVASVVVQLSYHLYYGWLGSTSLSFFFLVLGLYYARWRRAVPVIVAHGVLDIWGLIRLW